MNTNAAKFYTLEILSKDRNGLIYDISGTISQLNISILSHKAIVYNKNNKKISEFKADIRVEDDEQLKRLMSRLNKVKGVISIHSYSI